MTSCQTCGARTRTDDEVFCRACGSILAGSPARAAAGTRARGATWGAVAGPVAVAASGVAVLAVLAAAMLGVGQGAGATGPTIPAGSASPSAGYSDSPYASPTASPPGTGSEVTALLSHLPAAIVDSCVEDEGFEELTAGMRAAVVCDDLGSDYTDTLAYMLYDSDASMQAAYDYVVEGYTGGSLPKRGNCDDGQARGRWYSDSVEAGSFACYPSDTSGVRMWWTTDGTAILARAADDDMSVKRIWKWFLATSTGPF